MVYQYNRNVHYGINCQRSYLNTFVTYHVVVISLHLPIYHLSAYMFNKDIFRCRMQAYYLVDILCLTFVFHSETCYDDFERQLLNLVAFYFQIQLLKLPSMQVYTLRLPKPPINAV